MRGPRLLPSFQILSSFKVFQQAIHHFFLLAVAVDQGLSVLAVQAGGHHAVAAEELRNLSTIEHNGCPKITLFLLGPGHSTFLFLVGLDWAQLQ